MKKLLGIIVLGLLLCNVGAAEIRLLERELIDQGTNRSMVVSTICVDGFKFVTTYDQLLDKDASRISVSTSITQMFMRSTEKNSFPVRC